MNRILAALALLSLLAACGADGAPQAPAAEPGVSISGQVEIGVAGGS